MIQKPICKKYNAFSIIICTQCTVDDPLQHVHNPQCIIRYHMYSLYSVQCIIYYYIYNVQCSSMLPRDLFDTMLHRLILNLIGCLDVTLLNFVFLCL